MSEQRIKDPEIIPLTEAGWRDQRLIAAELRRLREKAGLTQDELAEKLGKPYTEELNAQYEDGRAEVMETWAVFDIVDGL